MSTSAAQPLTKPKRNRWLIIGIIAAALLGICMICVVVGALFPSGDDPASEAQLPSVASDVPVEAEVQVETVTEAPLPTEAPTFTPRPTNTPAPTDTPEPTATPDPDLVIPGTHLVGTDIQPGLYKGFAGDNILDSCYWARLANLSGDLESILANDNSSGQFYVEVLESDLALENACQLRLFHPELVSVTEFPREIGPGDYLVGVDIQPGTYRGEAGADILDSCYWERVSNFTGEFDSLIANDNSVGQYFIEVRAGDYGLNTGCPLELVD